MKLPPHIQSPIFHPKLKEKVWALIKIFVLAHGADHSMVLPSPSRFASEIALFVTGHPSEEWLAKIKKQADDADEFGTAFLTIIEGDFTGWSIEKLGRYLVDNFADAECPVACGSFTVADEESEETDSFLLIELTPRYLLRDRTIVIEGAMRVGPEYGVQMPVIFHSGTKSIGIFAQEPGDILRMTEVTENQVVG